jgi:hypothetical protein
MSTDDRTLGRNLADSTRGFRAQWNAYLLTSEVAIVYDLPTQRMAQVQTNLLCTLTESRSSQGPSLGDLLAWY